MDERLSPLLRKGNILSLKKLSITDVLMLFIGVLESLYEVVSIRWFTRWSASLSNGQCPSICWSDGNQFFVVNDPI